MMAKRKTFVDDMTVFKWAGVGPMLFNVRLALVVQNYELLSTSLGPYEKTV